MSSTSRLTVSITDSLERWPFKCGESPLHLKGVAFSVQKELVEKMAPGGLSAVLDVANRQDLNEFLEQRFFPSSFYDVFPMSIMSYAHARLIGQTYTDHTRDMAARQAKHDLGGIYSMLLKVVSPHRAIKGLVGVTNKYHDFAPITYQKQDKREAVVLRPDYPLLLSPWYLPVIEGYAKAVIVQAGGRDAWTDVRVKPNPGTAHGLALIDLEIRMGWS